MIYIKKNTTQKYKDRATQNPPKPVVNNGLEGQAVPAPHVALVPLLLLQKVMNQERTGL
jgi:hypothetical protein